METIASLQKEDLSLWKIILLSSTLALGTHSDDFTDLRQILVNFPHTSTISLHQIELACRLAAYFCYPINSDNFETIVYNAYFVRVSSLKDAVGDISPTLATLAASSCTIVKYWTTCTTEYRLDRHEFFKKYGHPPFISLQEIFEMHDNRILTNFQLMLAILPALISIVFHDLGATIKNISVIDMVSDYFWPSSDDQKLGIPLNESSCFKDETQPLQRIYKIKLDILNRIV